MKPASKHVRKLLRQAADEAYRRELDRELQALQAAFERWQRRDVTAFDLADRIHQFHQGPSRELYVRYSDTDPHFAVAGAVDRGILQQDELHPDLLPLIAPSLETIRLLGSGG